MKLRMRLILCQPPSWRGERERARVDKTIWWRPVLLLASMTPRKIPVAGESCDMTTTECVHAHTTCPTTQDCTHSLDNQICYQCVRILLAGEHILQGR